jgi:TonB family protein
MDRSLKGVLVVLIIMAIAPASWTQDGQSSRKLVVKVAPAYPELARKINASGAVKMLVTVAPSGTVKEIKVFGGHPVLSQAAEHAVQKWKWAPASEETKEPVEVNFHPD